MSCKLVQTILRANTPTSLQKKNIRYQICTGFVWERIKSFHIRLLLWCCVVDLWPNQCYQHSKICFSYCWAGPAQLPRHFLVLTLPCHSSGWEWARIWRGYSWYSWPHMTKGIQPYDAVFSSSRWEGRRGNVCTQGIYPLKYPGGVTEPCFPAMDGWMDTCPPLRTTELTSLCVQLLLPC